jgi:tetratricopeptide (TPR) repeat protein
MALGLMLALFVPFATAYAQQPAGQQPAQQQPAAQDPKQQEADAYKAWYEANNAKDIPKAIELARAYLSSYPTGQYADYLKKWMSGARGHLFNEAIKAKNVNEMIRIGKEALAETPEDLNYLISLASNIRVNELFASPANFSHATDAAEFSRRAITLVEAGKMPAGTDQSKWNKNATLAWLYQNLAVIEAKNNNPDKALEHYKKSSTLEPNDPSLNAFNYLACGSLHQAKYQAAAKKFSELPEADRADVENKPEAKAVLDEVNKQADMVIECWARFMASPKSADYGDTRARVDEALKNLYKYRHPDSTDGLQKLIDQYRNGATPPASTSASTTKS